MKYQKKNDEIIKMPHPEYCYVDTAFGDVRNRNNVKRLDEIVLPDPPVECYASMFRFREEFKEHCDETDSVKNIASLPCYCDYLWFDIDDEDIGQAIVKASDLIIEMEHKLEIKPDQLAIFFSGCKRFHIGIPSTAFGAEPSVDLPMIFKRMAIEIAGDIKIDTAIYDKNRLWRLPNSINKKSDLFKIPLGYEELAQYDSEAIKKLAGGKRELPGTASIIPTPLQALSTQLYNKVKTEIVQQKNTSPTVKPITTPGVTKHCLEKLLEGVEEGQRNEAGIRLADYFKKLGNSQEQALSRLQEWNKRNQLPLSDEETTAIVNSAFTGNYDYGCNDPLLKSLCDPKCPLRKKDKGKKPIITSFEKFPDGALLEMLYNPENNPQTYFAKHNVNGLEYVDGCLDPVTGIYFKPYEPSKIIRSLTIHFPSEAKKYIEENILIKQIDNFITRYLVISAFFHKISIYYVLLSWVYDDFSNLPYLRVKGDYGTGKTRFLQTVGSLCYKPIFCKGATSVSPIFRLIDAYRGTMIIDESDFNDSDDSNKIIKILNSGFQKGFPVLLTETIGNNKFEPMSFDVFGPKLIATRHDFKDKALESRCITEIMDKIIRPDIPINLPSTFWDEARDIRNQLLSWRFDKFGKIKEQDYRLQLPVEPRLAQIMYPLMSIIDDDEITREFINFMQDRNKQIIEERGESLDGKVAEVVCQFWNDETKGIIRIKEIAEEVNRHLDNPQFEIKPRKTSHILRKVFNLTLNKDKQGSYVERSSQNQSKLINIANKFGIPLSPSGERAQCAQSSPAIGGQQVIL